MCARRLILASGEGGASQSPVCVGHAVFAVHGLEQAETFRKQLPGALVLPLHQSELPQAVERPAAADRVTKTNEEVVARRVVCGRAGVVAGEPGHARQSDKRPGAAPGLAKRGEEGQALAEGRGSRGAVALKPGQVARVA